MTLTLAINGSLGFVFFKRWGESGDDDGNKEKQRVHIYSSRANMPLYRLWVNCSIHACILFYKIYRFT